MITPMWTEFPRRLGQNGRVLHAFSPGMISRSSSAIFAHWIRECLFFFDGYEKFLEDFPEWKDLGDTPHSDDETEAGTLSKYLVRSRC